MIQFDKTQPIRDRDAPRYDYVPGQFLRQIIGDSWEVVDIDGKHLRYLVAESIEYESSIGAEMLKQRSYRQ